MITTTIGKRARKQKQGQRPRPQRPFRAPRQRRGVIPGLLRQTAIEKKVCFFGTNATGGATLAFNSTGSVIALNLIQVGSSMFNRIGRKIEMRSLRLTGSIDTLTVTRATVSPDLGKIMIVYDRQTNGALPAITDIVQDTDQTGVNQTGPRSGINMNNRERFVKIVDIIMTLPQATATAGVLTNVYPNDLSNPHRFDVFRQLRGLTTHYGADSNPAVIGDIRTGGLYIVAFAQQGAGTELYSSNWSVRLKYTDA